MNSFKFFESFNLNFASLAQVSIALLVLLLISYFFKIRNSYNFFKKRGIKTPDYEFFFGNQREIERKKYTEAIREWTQKLGKTYGYYEGHLPVLVTSDLDLIQQIFVKQFANFSARKKMAINKRENANRLSLFQSSKLRWKRLRNIMNPTFSTSKLRELSPLMIKTADRLVDALKQVETEKTFNIITYFKRFTMDTIWNCAFGVDINVQDRTKNNDYFNKCEEFVKLINGSALIMQIGTYFSELKELIIDFILLFNVFTYKVLRIGASNPSFWLFENVDKIVEKRKRDNIKKRDYLQLVLEAELYKNPSTQNTSDSEGEGQLDPSGVRIEKKLSSDEVKSSLMSFMIAGYETTSTTLCYCAYVLSKYENEQQKLYDEISSAFGTDSNSIDVNTILQLEYLDMFVKEVLRLYPITTSIVGRRCTKPTTINGIDFELDQAVVIDIMSIHLDPEIYGPHDPKLFYPQRFSPEIKRHPLSFLSFGLGPRVCIGMKFALIEIKLALAKMLMDFEVVDAKSELEIIEGVGRTPKNTIDVILRKRDKSA